MKAHTPKIVRNKIPDKIKDNGENCKFFIANTTEKYKFLVLKIIEELEEVSNSKETKDIYNEIGDLQQVTLDLLNFILSTPFEAYSKQENFINIRENNLFEPYSFYSSYYKLWKRFGDISNKKEIIGLLQSLNNRLNDFISINKFDSKTIEEYRLEKTELSGGFDEGIILTDY